MITTLPTSDAACELRGLTKIFARNRAVDGLDLSIARGEFYAFLGPNGAGKTTTLRMTAGLLAPTRGKIFLGGIPLHELPAEAKRVLAYVPDEPVLYGKLRPLEQLEFVAALWNMPASEAAPRAEELLRQFELWEKRGDYIETFSRGMMQKMALACALIHRPQVLLLDEPLTGLDAQSARFVKDLLNEFVRAGNTVILTTHILEVAERMAQRIGIIHRGKLAAEGTLDELRARAGHAAGTLEDVFLTLTREVEAVPPFLP
jgi:ABC-2 type transport system ATP-binding protein